MSRRWPLAILLLCSSTVVMANSAPVVDSFVATPTVASPGQAITLKIVAHDPDCATSCTTGCGLTIRGDLLTWSDNTGRTPSPFQSSVPGATGSPWSATVTWIAPPTEGTYNVTAQLADSGGMLCGGRKATLATLSIAVTSAQPPVIDSFSVMPNSVPVGGLASLTVAAHDTSGRPLTFAFSADAGSIAQSSPSSTTAQWIAPQSAGTITLRVRVSASASAFATSQTTATVQIGTYSQTLKLPETRVTRVAALPDGRLAAVDGANGTLQLTSSTGQASWKKDGLATPVGVAVSAGQIFVLERGATRISVWDSNGTRLREFPVSAALPNNLAAGPNPGEISITDTAAAVVQVVSSVSGQLFRIVGNGLLQAPVGLAISNGRMAVADAAAGKVLLFDAAGAPAGALGDDTLLVRPQGLAWDAANTRLAVADSFSGEVIILGEEGTVRGSLAGFGNAPGQIINAIDVALAPGGMLAVTTAGGDVPMYRLLNSLAPVRPPAAISASDRIGDDGGAISITWTASPDDPARVIAYVIERATGSGSSFQPIARVDVGTTSYLDTTTVDGTCYLYEVIATDGATDAASDPSPCATSRNDLPPPAPASATASPESPFAVRVAWSAVTAADLAGYKVDFTATGAARSVTVDRNTTSTVIASLTPDTVYSVSVRAFDTAANTSPAASATAKTWPDVPPVSPQAVIVTDAATGSTADVKWTQPDGPVPVAKYTVTFKPAVAGWPAITATSATTTVRVTGLVNRLPYMATVVATTPWQRDSAPSPAADALVTAPPRALPIIAQAGWDGSTGIADAAGISVTFPIESEKRELRFQYRTSGSSLKILLDGDSSGVTLGTTAGAWGDASITLEKRLLKNLPVHTLELRNADFPSPSAQLAFRRIDFVPLPPKDLKTAEMNTVIDLAWTWQEPRPDLIVNVLHAIDKGDKKDLQYSIVQCAAPLTGRCRDTFLGNGDKYNYRFAIASPAGWSSDVIEVSGHAKYDEGPPPVTDVQIESGHDGFRLSWTPLSTATTKNASPSAVKSYRVYRKDSAGLTLLGEVAAPSMQLPVGAFDPAKESIVVRSVDTTGKESL